MVFLRLNVLLIIDFKLNNMTFCLFMELSIGFLMSMFMGQYN